MLRDSPVLVLTLGSLNIVCVIVGPLGASPDRMRHKLVGRFGRSTSDTGRAVAKIFARNQCFGRCTYRHASVARYVGTIENWRKAYRDLKKKHGRTKSDVWYSLQIARGKYGGGRSAETIRKHMKK